MQNYLHKVKREGMPNIVGVEVPYSFKHNDDVEVRGFIDRIDLIEPGHYGVVDYKTSKSADYLTPKQLTAFVKKFQDSGECVDAIVIDYVNLLHSTIGSNSYERVKYICEQVRAMSYIFKCPIISATQLNKSGFKLRRRLFNERQFYFIC